MLTVPNTGASTVEARSQRSKPELYSELLVHARGIVQGESDRIANAANLAALLFLSLPALNWAGFYFLQGEELVLGPFQGKPACVRIAWGRGVCGRAVATGRSVLVPDVHAFEGHIACDAASRAELVVPLRQGEQVLGVLDLDSPQPGRFDHEDQQGIEDLAALYVEACRLSEPVR